MVVVEKSEVVEEVVGAAAVASVAVDKLEAGMVSKSVGSVEVLISFDVVLVVRIHEDCQGKIVGFRDGILSFGFPRGRVD